MRDETKKAIETARYFLVQGKPDTAAFVLRDLHDTEEKGLHDLAWAMCRDDSYVHENDVEFLIEQLKA